MCIELAFALRPSAIEAGQAQPRLVCLLSPGGCNILRVIMPHAVKPRVKGRGLLARGAVRGNWRLEQPERVEQSKTAICFYASGHFELAQPKGLR